MDTREKLAEYCKTRDPALRNALAEDFLYLAHAVAKRFSGRGAETEDLKQVASMALLSALERFDCGLGLAFTTFAMPTLAGAVRNYIRDKARLVRLPRRGSELLPRLLQEREAFWQKNGREATADELALALGVQTDAVLDALEMQRAALAVSIDATLSEDGQTLEDLLGNDEAAYDRVDESDQVDRLLAQLEGTSRFIIEERFLRQRSQREIAKDLGVSQMQVSRLERRALTKLREKHA